MTKAKSEKANESTVDRWREPAPGSGSERFEIVRTYSIARIELARSPPVLVSLCFPTTDARPSISQRRHQHQTPKHFSTSEPSSSSTTI